MCTQTGSIPEDQDSDIRNTNCVISYDCINIQKW